LSLQKKGGKGESTKRLTKINHKEHFLGCSNEKKKGMEGNRKGPASSIRVILGWWGGVWGGGTVCGGHHRETELSIRKTRQKRVINGKSLQSGEGTRVSLSKGWGREKTRENLDNQFNTTCLKKVTINCKLRGSGKNLGRL